MDRIMGAVLLGAALAAAVRADIETKPAPGVLWREEFERVGLGPRGYKGWRVVGQDGRPRAVIDAANGVARMAVAPGQHHASVTRYVPYQFDRKSPDFAQYLQVRVAAGRGVSWLIADGSIYGCVMPSVAAARRGVFTASYFAATRPDLKGKSLSGRTALNIYLSGKGSVSFDSILMARRPMEGVFFTLIKAPGAPAAEVDLARPGDRLRIEMPNPERLDANDISLWRPGKRQLIPVAQAHLPPCLYDDGSHGDRLAGDHVYACEFEVSPMAAEVKLGVNELIADVHAFGQDQHDRGHFYGLCPYPVALPAGAVAAAESALRLYDFGGPQTPLFPGAVQINPRTRYDAKRGAGWTRVPYYRPLAGKMLDALAQDGCRVAPGKWAQLRVDVPPGRYHVEVCTGFAGLLRNHYLPLRAYRVQANSVTLIERRLGDAEYLRERLRYMDTDYRADEPDVYDLYLAPLLEPHGAVVSAPDGKIELRIDAQGSMGVPVCWLAVYPADAPEAKREAKREAQARLERIERQRRQGFHAFWSYSQPPQMPITDPLTLADDGLPRDVKDSGYAVFTRRDPFEYVYVYSRPRRTELARPVSLLACPGQTEPASVGLYPLRHLRGVRIAASDLTTGERRIPSACIDLFYVVQFHYANARNRVYWVAPNQLLPPGERDFEPGVCRNYWLRVRTPADAEPGEYRGRLTLSVANAPDMTLPIRLRVLPLRLPALDDHLIAFINSMFFRGDAYLDREMEFMRDIGCTAGELHFSWAVTSKFEIANGRIVGGQIDGHPNETIDRFLERYRKVGFPFRRPVMGLMALNPGYGFRFGKLTPSDPLYRDAVHWCYDQLAARARAKGFDGIVAYLGGEMGSGPRDPKPETLAQAAEVVKIINETPHVTTLYDCNCGASARVLSPLLGIAGMRQPQAWAFADCTYRRGQDKWLVTYSIGGRYRNGLDSWRHGARGNFREYLTYPVMMPYNGFAGPCLPAHVHAGEGLNGPVPTIRSEMWRAAVDDRRYLRLLEHALSKRPAHDVAAQARRFLAALRADCDAQPNPTFTGHWRAGDNEPRDIDQNLVRGLLAAYALRLQGLDAPAAAIPDVARPQPAAKPAPAAPPQFAPQPPPAEAAPQYDDRTWVPVRTGRSWESQGILYDGVGWYRTRFQLPADWSDAWLYFEAVDEIGWVYVNGRYVGAHDGWNEPFALPIGQVAAAGSENVLAVRVLDSAYQGGIWKPVWLYRSRPKQDAVRTGKRMRLSGPWRLALRPSPDAAGSEFKLKFGRFYRQGEAATIATLTLFPPNDATAQQVLGQGVTVEIAHANGPVVARQPVSGVRIYRPTEAAIDLRTLDAGAYVARIDLAGQRLEYPFYVVREP